MNPASDPRCCCCSIKAGTIVVAIFEFIGIVITLLIVVAFYKQGGAASVSSSASSSYTFVGPDRQPVVKSSSIIADKRVKLGNITANLFCTIIGFIIGAASIIGLLIGVIKERPKLVFAHLIVQGLAILGFLIGVIVYSLIASGQVPISEEDLKPDHFAVYVDGEQVRNATASPQKLEELRDDIMGARRASAIGFSVMMSIAAVLQMYYMFVVFKCFRYLASKALQ